MGQRSLFAYTIPIEIEDETVRKVKEEFRLEPYSREVKSRTVMLVYNTGYKKAEEIREYVKICKNLAQR